MAESRAPRGTEWADVVEVLHALSTVMAVRAHYVEGHPAIARTDAAAAAGFNRLLDRVPELVVALIDGEFVVSERPLPELRERLASLASAMTRHELECIVFQRGITAAECALLGRTLVQPQAEDPARVREETQAGLAHVLLRFADIQANDPTRREGTSAEYLVPAVAEVLASVARAFEREQLVDRAAVRAVAARVVNACRARAFALEQRAHAPGIADDAPHAANVALMTAAMALDAGYDDATCLDAAAAAIVHDVGLALLPEGVRGVPQPLLDESGLAAYREHPALGACALLGAGCPPLWVAAALEHHRGVDGAGYPALDSRAPPHELVRMISLASFFDRRRTRVNGAGDEPEEALRRAVSLADRYFGRATVRRFLRALGAYPPGTLVELSDRSAAIVLHAASGDPLRPQVRVLFGEGAGKRVELRDLDAVEDRHVLSVVRAIPPPLAVRVARAEDAPAPPIPAAAPLPVIPAPLAASVPPTAPLVTEAPVARASRAPRASSGPSASRPPIPRDEPDAPAPRVSSPRIASPHVSVRPSGAPRVSKPPIPRDEPAEDAAPPADVLSRLDAVPTRGGGDAELAALGLDHRAGFILSFVDGASSIDTILDACGLPRALAVALLSDLVARGAIRLP